MAGGRGGGRSAPRRAAVDLPATGAAGRRRALRRFAVAVAVLAVAAATYGAWGWYTREAADTGVRLLAEGRYRAAIRELQARLATDPGNAQLHYYLGLAYARADVPDGAINQLREAVRLAPRQAPYHLALGQTYRLAGDQARALAELEEAVRLDPDEPRAEAVLAGLLLEQGHIDAALGHLRHAVARSPREVELRFLLAEALRQAGDRDGMAREYREVIQLAPERLLAEAARQQLRAALEAGANPAGSEPTARSPAN